MIPLYLVTLLQFSIPFIFVRNPRRFALRGSFDVGRQRPHLARRSPSANGSFPRVSPLPEQTARPAQGRICLFARPSPHGLYLRAADSRSRRRAGVADGILNALTRLRGLGHFSPVRIKEINALTKKVFTTGVSGGSAVPTFLWAGWTGTIGASCVAEPIMTHTTQPENPTPTWLVFTSAVFGVVSADHINQFRHLKLAQSHEVGLSTGESAKTG